ncbi:MFS transporter [Roseateles aquatilis]|nr:MFS transporter [Roseateles aquatilis]
MTVRGPVVLAVLAGSALEFYDFVAYAFFAPFIGRAFFPSADPTASLLGALAVFAVGFVARPVGGLWFGRYADRAGRRPAMLLSMAIIGVATVAIAVLPTHAQIGVAAPVLLVLLRLVQGLCFGGEVGPASAYLWEAAPVHRRGLYCASLFASQGAAVALAGVVGALVAAWLSDADMQRFGWRIPFLIGALAAPLVLMLRSRMSESMPAAGDSARGRGAPVRAGVVVSLTLVVLGGTVANYICSYLPTFASVQLKLSTLSAMTAAIQVGLLTLVFGLLGGWLSDRGHRRAVLLGSRLACGVAAVPLFLWLVDEPTTGKLIVTAAVLAATNALNGGAMFSLLPAAFGAGNRAVSISLVYAMGVALFGGSTQYVVAWLGKATASPMAPAVYLLATSAIAFVALLRVAGSGRSDEVRGEAA